jgi:hypothetical protein
MQIPESAVLNTKMWVPRIDAMAVQSALLKNPNIGYELALGKSQLKHKFPRNIRAVAFFIDNSGFLEFFEVTNDDYYDCLDEYDGSPEQEINYEVTLSN